MGSTVNVGLCWFAGMAYVSSAAVPHGRQRSLKSGAFVRDNGPSADPAELIERCARGDRSAFRQLYDLQSARLYGVALRITRQPGLAADAVHDAFLQVWQNAARFDATRGNVDAWLLSLVRYRALDITRRRVREVAGLEVPEQADEDPDPLAQLVSSTEGAALHRCLKTLEADRQTLLSLAYVEGLSHSELSTRLNVPLGTVKSWIRRALAALKACLEP